MSKRLTKTIWYGSGVDSNGNPILPSNNGGLDGLNYGELYLHLSNDKATLWTLSSDGKIVEITGGADVDMSKYLLKSIWEKVFEIRADSQGTDYIFSKLPVVTQYGITMYSGEGVNIPSLASGLPFDGRTIWYNPDTNQIEVIGGTGGGSGEGVSNFWDLSGIPSWITISKPKYTYSEIEGTPDLSVFATQDWIINQGYASAEELKKYIPISGYTEVSGEKNFTGGLKVNGSPIYYDTEKQYWKLEGDLLVTGGVTMYGVDSTDIPSLINSLPVATTKEKGVAYFDPNFFSVSSDGKVSFIGETGGGLDITALQNYLTQNSYLNVTEGDNRYLKLSGGTMSGDITLTKNSGKSTSYSINFFDGTHKYLFTEGGVLKYGIGTNMDTIIHSGNVSSYNAGSATKLQTARTIWGQSFDGTGDVSGILTLPLDNQLQWADSGGAMIYGASSKRIIIDGNVGIGTTSPAYKLDVNGTLNATTIYQNGTTLANTYLPLSGGTINGQLIISKSPSTIAFKNAQGTFLGHIGYGGVDNPVVYMSNGLTVHSLLHEGNFSSYALPLSGGVVKGVTTINGNSKTSAPLEIETPSMGYHGYIKFANSGTTIGYLGMGGIDKPVFRSSAEINYTLWHSGNDGSDSGLDADLLDGLDATAFFCDKGASNSFDDKIYNGAYRTSSFSPNDAYGYGLVASFRSMETCAQIYFPDRNGEPQFRMQWNSQTSITSGWTALVTSSSIGEYNAGSATKLQTARTIWGQYFDGTGNVSGALSDVTGITFKDDYYGLAIDAYGNFSFKKPSSTTAADWSFKDSSGNKLIIINNSGNVGIGTTSPSHKLHVVGNTYLNGDVFADDLNTYDVIPRSNNFFSCGNSSSRWYQVYSNIGDFSGAVSMGSTLNVTGMTTMTNATITGDLRLKDTTNYGRTIYFGDGELCYLEEASDDVLTIYANAGIKLNTSSTSYNVSINTNLLVSGGITMYSQRSLKNIQDERGLSLGELGAIKPIRYTWKDNRDNRLHIGGIADDIQQVLPEVVYKTNDGVLTMDYGNAAFAIASSLIKPVVDHEKRIAMLEEENKELRNEIERLKSA